METKRISKFLSLLLRHRPEVIGLQLDNAGWAPIEELLSLLEEHQQGITREQLEQVVRENHKQRFKISEDGLHIRASQGHSIPVQLDLERRVPPVILYHGTATRHLDGIRQKGLLRMQRQHVHLSARAETAHQVGSRHGKPVILEVAAGRMDQAGFHFFLSDNGVWLTEQVPVEFLQFPE